jgi:hypothetical protein
VAALPGPQIAARLRTLRLAALARRPAGGGDATPDE